MPNYCENDLIVLGDNNDIFRMVAAYFECDGSHLWPDFNKIIPAPRDHAADAAMKVWDDAANIEGYESATKRLGRRPKDWFNSGGYEWCVQNWGTKWPACGDCGYHMTDARLRCWFETAWSKPTPVIVALSKKFPDLCFEMTSFERGSRAFSVLVVKNGDVLQETSGDYKGERGG